MRKYDKAYDVWRGTSPHAEGVEPWQSKLRIPYAKQVIDTELVNIVSGYPRVQVTARHPEFEIPAAGMQYVMDHYVGEDHFVEKQPVFAHQALVYGVTAAKVHWLYKTTRRPVRVNRMNEAGVGVKMQEYVLQDGPTFEPWDIYRIYWEPGARDVDSAAYVVLQSYLSADELRANAWNPDRKTGLYHNVEELIASGGMGGQKHTTAQERVDRVMNRENVRGKFLIEEIWTDSTLTVIGNGKVLLRSEANPFWHGKKPVVITQTAPDMFEMLGISDTELCDHLQQALWTVLNRRMDNQHLTVMRGITYREGGVTNPDDLVLRPRFRWPVNDHGDIQPFEVQPLPPEAYQEETALLARLQLVTGVNPYVSGSDLQTVDQNTATGVTALQDVASRVLRFKAGQLAYKGYQRVFEQWGDLIQQFLDKPLAVKIVGYGGDVTWLDLGPSDVEGHFGYRIQGTEESLSRQQERGEAIALLNAFAPLAPLNLINFEPLVERIAQAYDFPSPQSLLVAQQQQQAAPQPQQQMQGLSPDQIQQMQHNVVPSRLGMVPQRDSMQQQAGLLMDPRLQQAISQMGLQLPR